MVYNHVGVTEKEYFGLQHGDDSVDSMVSDVPFTPAGLPHWLPLTPHLFSPDRDGWNRANPSGSSSKVGVVLACPYCTMGCSCGKAPVPLPATKVLIASVGRMDSGGGDHGMGGGEEGVLVWLLHLAKTLLAQPLGSPRNTR